MRLPCNVINILYLLAMRQRYQVTALTVLDKYLYIGTTWGCVIVANAMTLHHYTVFRCHSDQDFFIRTILPLYENADHSPDGSTVGGVVTVGKGYVPLIQPNVKTETVDDRESDFLTQHKSRTFSEFDRNTHILSWLAKHWQC